MKKLIIFCLLMLAAAVCHAQGSAKGKIVDSATGEPLSFVNVSVYDSATQKFIKGAMSDDKGQFNIGGLPYGNYTVKMSYIGYTDVARNFTVGEEHKHENMNLVHMTENSQTLEEVTVTAQRPGMRLEVDRKSFDVSQDINNAGMAATDVLESDPNMQEILEAGMSGFGTSIHFSQPHIDPRTGRVVVGPDPERRSGMLMNNLMLRAIAPEITDRVARQRAVYAASRGGNYAGDQAAKNHFADLISEAQSNGVGRDELNASIAFQKAVKEGAGQTQQGGRFRGLMARIFRRRRGY